MITEVPGDHPIHSAQDRDTARDVFERIQPLLKRIGTRRGEGVADLH